MATNFLPADEVILSGSAEAHFDRLLQTTMTQEQFAEALARLVAEAEDAGLDPEKILAEIEDMADAMRMCVEE